MNKIALSLCLMLTLSLVACKKQEEAAAPAAAAPVVEQAAPVVEQAAPAEQTAPAVPAEHK
jgi:hypothetical protein